MRILFFPFVCMGVSHAPCACLASAEARKGIGCPGTGVRVVTCPVGAGDLILEATSALCHPVDSQACLFGCRCLLCSVFWTLAALASPSESAS